MAFMTNSDQDHIHEMSNLMFYIQTMQKIAPSFGDRIASLFISEFCYWRQKYPILLMSFNVYGKKRWLNKASLLSLENDYLSASI
jgi:hypothetical protein